MIHFRLAIGRLHELEVETRCPILAPIVNRITPIALASAGILAVTGLFNKTRHLDSLRAIIASPYGLTLLSKMLLLLPVLRSAGRPEPLVPAPRSYGRAMVRTSLVSLRLPAGSPDVHLLQGDVTGDIDFDSRDVV